MKRTSTLIAALAMYIACIALGGCSQKSAEERTSDQLALVHGLTDTERALANANAKAFYERPWAPAGGKLGQFIACRPSDSNFNGLVTCTGYIPQADGTMPEIPRYCGYRKELVGCSDEDTVK